MKLPSNLLPETVELMNNISDTLQENKNAVDDFNLVILAIDYDMLLRSYKQITDNDIPIIEKNGQPNKYLFQIRAFQSSVMQMMKELGLTLRMRKSLKLDEKEDDEDDPLKNFQ